MAKGKIVILGIGGRGCAALQRLAMAELPDNVMTMVVSADKRALSSKLMRDGNLLPLDDAVRRPLGTSKKSRSPWSTPWASAF